MATATAESEVDTEKEEQIESNYTKLEQLHYQQITEKELEVEELRGKQLAAKEKASAAKKALETGLLGLCELIKRGPNPQQQLPFGKTDAEQKEPVDLEALWDAVLLDEVGFTVDVMTSFNEAGIKTMAQLKEVSNGPGFASIKGISKRKSEKITDALAEFQQQWNREHAPVAGACTQRVKLTKDVEGFTEDGLTAGREIDVFKSGDAGEITVKSDSGEMIGLKEGEYEAVAEAEDAIDDDFSVGEEDEEDDDE